MGYYEDHINAVAARMAKNTVTEQIIELYLSIFTGRGGQKPKSVKLWNYQRKRA